MKRREFTEAEELEIIEYYKTHTDNNTGAKFHVHFNPRILEILSKYNIQRHTKEENSKLKSLAIKNGFLQKYGVDNCMRLEEVRKKVQATNIDKYGVSVSTQNKDIVNKMKQTNLKRYGVEVQAQRSESMSKRKQTCLDKYGVKEVTQAEEVKAKMRMSMIEHFGVSYPSQNQEINTKIINTKLDKYGTVCLKHKYKYCEQFFDSFPELCFYLFHIEHSIAIKREPIKFEYIFNEKVYNYFPDFDVDGKLVELKGDQFLSEDSS